MCFTGTRWLGMQSSGSSFPCWSCLLGLQRLLTLPPFLNYSVSWLQHTFNNLISRAIQLVLHE